MQRPPRCGGQLAEAVDDVDASLTAGGLDLDVGLAEDEVVLLGPRPQPGGQRLRLPDSVDEPIERHQFTEQPDLLVLAQPRCAREQSSEGVEGHVERTLQVVTLLELVGDRLEEGVCLVLDAPGLDGDAEPDGLVPRLLDDVGADHPVGGDVDVRARRRCAQRQLPARRVDAQDAEGLL